jgi:proton-translocating NADH-quinone oxidoreductase chain N
MDANTALLLVIILPLIASPVIYLIGRLVERRSHLNNPARWVALVALMAEFIPLSVAARAFLEKMQPLEISIGMVALQMDGIGLLMAVVVSVLAFLVVLFSGTYMAHDDHQEKYYALLTAMAGMMIGLGCAADLFNLWVWFEGMAISSFMLVAFNKLERASLEAGVKYLVQSSVGSAFVLIGIALVFGYTGALSLEQIRSAAAPTPILLAAGGMFIIGFGVKAALVPLHTWLPDAHSQAPSGISAMLSGVVIQAGLVALLRSLAPLAGVSPSWGALLLGFGALNMLLGNLMALRQVQIKRLLAYSSLSHMGYILLGIGAAVSFGQMNAAAGGFFHIVTHALMKGLAFLAAGVLLYSLYISHGTHQPLMLEDLNGVSRRYPLAAFGLSLAVLSLGGLPPLAGFMSKWQIFVGGFETRSPMIIGLVLFAALNSVLSLAYYAPMVNRMYRQKPSHAVLAGKPASKMMDFSLIALSLGVVVLGFWPSLADWLTNPAAEKLLAIFGG